MTPNTRLHTPHRTPHPAPAAPPPPRLGGKDMRRWDSDGGAQTYGRGKRLRDTLPGVSHFPGQHPLPLAPPLCVCEEKFVLPYVTTPSAVPRSAQTLCAGTVCGGGVPSSHPSFPLSQAAIGFYIIRVAACSSRDGYLPPSMGERER